MPSVVLDAGMAVGAPALVAMFPKTLEEVSGRQTLNHGFHCKVLNYITCSSSWGVKEASHSLSYLLYFFKKTKPYELIIISELQIWRLRQGEVK